MDNSQNPFTPPTDTEHEASAESFAPVKEEIYTETDIFAWTNNVVQYVDDLKYTMYFFNKNGTPYRAKLPTEVERQLRVLFMDEILECVLGGIDTGLVVRGFEEAEKEEHVLQRTQIKNVTRLVELLRWLKHEQHNIETFKESEHDLKRMRGVIVSCFHKDLPAPFHIIKSLPSSQVMKGSTAWYIKEDAIRPFDEMTALKIPLENQLLAVNQDLFVFNEGKLRSLFGYDAKAASVAAKKVEEIESQHRLSFPDNLTMQDLVKDSPATIKKLQKIDPGLVSTEDLIKHAEEMGIEILTDDSGAVIIMNKKDLTTFVNLLNDDYMESPMTGQRYEIVRKKPLKPPKNEE